MRRMIMIGTAIAVLVTAGAAYAALNSYTAGFTFTPTKAGSKAKPVPVGMVEKLGASSTTPGNRAAPLVDIKTTIYGLIPTAKKFGVCTSKMITANHVKWDAACPKNSRVATGAVTARLGPGATLVGVGAPCTPALHVYNGGHNSLWFFFLVAPQAPGHSCATLTTGASAPYKGTIKVSHGNMITDVPLPPDVSTSAGGLNGVYGSLVKETLTWAKGFQSSVGCKGNKRPWSVQYTAVDQSQRETKTVTGSSPCKK